MTELGTGVRSSDWAAGVGKLQTF